MGRPNLGKLLASNAAQSANKFQDSFKKLNLNVPAITRFAPSPTGTIHLGSLRTALYNYLLARATNGKFILRLEDTDRTRLKPLAEQNIYDSLKFTNLHYDEGPIRQSERGEIYASEAQKLLEQQRAYRCFCSKERLDGLAASARKLWPPSTASYDRKCSHLSLEESNQRAASGEPFVLRFKSPAKWPKFFDLLHGEIESQTQINQNDVRFDDFVIIKSDGMPTYHFANVVDDTEMGITHVVRGEEWLPSTSKHVALYEALGRRDPPHFVHIPLLTGAGGKKLSKRKSDSGILELADAPHFISPEALVNFVALLGWSPHTKHNQGEKINEVLTLNDLEKLFSIAGLTTGNIQVDMSKLQFLNKQHFERILKNDFNEAVRRCHKALPEFDLHTTEKFLRILAEHTSCVLDYVNHITTVFTKPQHNGPKKADELKVVASDAINLISSKPWEPKSILNEIISKHTKRANLILRYSFVDGKSGTSIIEIMELLGKEEVLNRLQSALAKT